MHPLHDLSSPISWDYCSVPFKTKPMQFFAHFLAWPGWAQPPVALPPVSLANRGLQIALLPVRLRWAAPSSEGAESGGTSHLIVSPFCAHQGSFGNCCRLRLYPRAVSTPLPQAPPHQCFRCSASVSCLRDLGSTFHFLL